MASPLRDGSFDVAEIVLLATPSSSIWLGPPKVALAGDRFAKAKPVASQVQMSAGNQPVVVPGGRINQRTQLVLAAPTKKIELRYNLRGITIRSIPSRAGRALSVISPLVDGVPKTLPVALRISGNTVLNIGCPAAPRAGMFRRTPATATGQSKAAVAERSDRCPVRPTETAVNWRRSSRLEPADGPNTTGLSQGIWVRDDSRSS